MALAYIALDTNFKNMDEFTKEQKDQLKTWAEQRDAVLLEISNARTIEERLQITNRELAESSTNIVAQMNTVLGRIEELLKKEAELPALITREIATLQSKKSGLESQIPPLEKIVEILTSQKTSLQVDVASVLNTFEAINGQSLLLEKVVDKVTVISKTNTDKINSLVSDLAKSLEEIITVNKKNVLETNVVIEKLPAMMMELQKAGLLKTRETLIKIKP